MALKYRTKDGLADYEFSFEVQSDGSWRTFIVRQPPYRGRDEGLHSTHRLTDAGRYYVCWTRTLSTLQDAKTVAALWADKTQDYIKTGGAF